MSKKSVIILGSEIVLVVILYYFVKFNYVQFIPSCWIYQATGILCPACGGTRCISNLLKGNLVESFFSHIIFFLGIIYLGMVNILYVFNRNRKKKIATWLYPRYWYGIIFIILLLIYTILRNFL